MTAIIRVRTATGEIVDIPAIVGPQGPQGVQGIQGPKILDWQPCTVDGEYGFFDNVTKSFIKPIAI